MYAFSMTSSLVISALTLLVFCCFRGSFSQFTDCGGTVEGSRGTIQSPNFPSPFPVPLSCRWIIHAPENSKIVIYFTQYYLRRSLFITEYDSYESPTVNENENMLGEINTEDRVTSLVAYRPYVILALMVSDSANLNLRVEEFLGDVHGFNITWLIVPRDQPVKTDACSVHECSFLGNCMASADYSNYSCECYQGFYGKNCEKGPHCDWEKGRNMCLNGGKCRYFLGSLVNICDCPPGFIGVRCENMLKDEFGKDCTALKCSHHCEKSREGGELQCACDEGFRLDDDGKGCLEEEQYRVSVYMPTSNQTHLTERIDEVRANLDRISRLGTTLLQLSGLATAHDFNVDYISTAGVSLHFYVEKMEVDRTAQAFTSLLRGDQIFGVGISKENIEVTSNPRIKLLSLEITNTGPALEGKLLTLSCIARGSVSLEFRWFKDGLSFNLSLTKRNAWIIRLPETMEEKHISVLNIDGVTIYDKGVFTCEINDFNRTINRTIAVDVLQYPLIEVTPLTISAVKGQMYTFRCYSPDEKKRSFKYKWIKNNRPIDDADDEKIEDLMPSGSRLLIRNAMANNNYSCIVTNRAGTSSKTVFIFVAHVNTTSGLACPSNTLHGIRWNKTFGGCFSLRKCPTDALDFNARGIGDGYTKRRCTCKAGECIWHKPSYTGCQSVHLINLYDQMRMVQLGYKESQLMNVYNKLSQIATQARGRMLAGDLDITAQSLLMVLTTARDFPTLVTERFSSHALIDFMAILLEETLNLTQDEKEEIHAGGRILEMSEILSELKEQQLVTLDPVHNKKIDLKIEQFDKIVYDDMLLMTNKRKNNIPIIIKRKQSDQQRMKRNKDVTYEENDIPGLKVLKVHYDQSLLQVLDITKRKPLENELFMSDVFSYIPLGYNWPEKQKFYLIEIPHVQTMQKYAKKKKITYCLSWERIDREDNEGVWKQDSCFVVRTDNNVTQCACPLPGHFTVVLVPGNSTNIVTDPRASNFLLLVACSVSICVTLMAVCCYLIAWRYLQAIRHSIRFNFILSVFGINVICLVCLLKTDVEFLCLCGTILLQLFVVASFTFLLLDAVKLCNDIYSENHPTMENDFWKFILIGWGVPIFSVVCTLFMFTLVGFMKECHDWCWWHESHPHFYAVLIPVIILMIAHSGMLISCLVMIRKWTDQWRFIFRKRALLEIGCNFLLLILLTISIGAGIRVRNDNSMESKFFFLVSDIILTLIILLLLCIFNKPIRLSVRHWRCSSQNALQNVDLSRFRSRMQNVNHLEYSRAETERIHEYCSKVDRERYTNKHKQKLRILLNSSSSSGSSNPTSAATIVTELQRESWCSALQTISPKSRDKITHKVDSGISEGTGSDKSSSLRSDEFKSEFQRNVHPSSQIDLIKRKDRVPGKRKSSKKKTRRPANHEGSPFKLGKSHNANSLMRDSNDLAAKQQCIDKENEAALQSVSLSLLSNYSDRMSESKTSGCYTEEMIEISVHNNSTS